MLYEININVGISLPVWFFLLKFCVPYLHVTREHFYIFSITKEQKLHKTKATWEKESLELLISLW